MSAAGYDVIRKAIAGAIDRLLRGGPESAKAVAEKMGIHPSTISQWRNGQRTPDAVRLKQFCEQMAVSADELLEIKLGADMEAIGNSAHERVSRSDFLAAINLIDTRLTILSNLLEGVIEHLTKTDPQLLLRLERDQLLKR